MHVTGTLAGEPWKATATPAPWAPDLASAPLEVLELVCAHLTVPERVALTSCCRALWARPDVAGSAALWGELDARSKERELRWRRMNPNIDRRWFTASLGAWLARRGSAVRRLRLQGLITDPGSLLRSLLTSTGCSRRGGSGGGAGNAGCSAGAGAKDSSPLDGTGSGRSGGCLLESLVIHENEAVVGGRGAAAALEPLSELTALTLLQVSWCGLERLPEQLPALHALRDLVLAGSALGGPDGQASLALLRHLTALSRLDLSACGLPAVPQPLAELAASLADLNLAGNEDLGEGGEEAFAPLGGMHRLTHLSLGRCGLLGLPPQLAGIPALEDLGLGENYYLGAGGEAAFAPLVHVAGSLSRLKLNHCGIERVPWQLGELSCLQDLSLMGNPLGQGGQGALAPIAALSSLTRLVLRGCGLTALPAAELPPLRALRELQLGHNRGLGRRRGGGGTAAAAAGAGAAGDGGFQCLRQMQALQRLDLRSCGLRELPSSLQDLVAAGVEVDWE